MKKHLLFIFAVCTLLSACKVEIDSSRDNQENPPIEKILLVSYQTDYGEIPDSLKDGIEVKENTVLTTEQLPVLTADDVVFKGWYDGTTLAVAGEYKVTKSVTLKAYWNTMSTVTLKTDSETVSSIIKCTGEIIEESEIPVLSKNGYTFNGWFAEEIQLTAGYIITKDITFIPKWTANEYTITFNSNNTAAQTSTQKVTYDTTVKLAECTFTYDGYRFAGWNVSADGKGASYSDGSDFAVTITENITLYAQWAESDRYIIKYENTNGVDNTNPVSYRKTEGAALTDLTPPIGYIFEGWYDSADSNGNGSGNKVESWGVNQKTGDLTLYAKWSPRTDIVYKVEHWQQNIADDGYTLTETDTLTGTTTTQTNAVAKAYTGFNSKSFEQTTIAANGSSVVKIYYDRNLITYTFNANGGNWSGDTSNKTVSGKYGATVTVPENPALTGYTFSEWSAEIPAIFGTENLTFTASYTASNATAYKVEHWQQNITDDGYTRIATDNLTGTTATQTAAAARTYTGFTSKSFEQTTIAANGSTVVRIEYDRNLITYTFNANGGNWSGDTSNKTVSGKYGATVTAPAAPAKTGYTFGSWNATVPETFGSTNVTFTAQWVEGTGTAYKVEHYQQNADDNEYTLKDTENLVGTTAAQTAAAAKTYDNFTAGAVTQASIAADGSTIVKIYYTRNNVTLTLNLDGGSLGTQTGTATITGKYGSSYTIETPVKTGYAFASWSSTLPAKLENGTYTAIYTANTNTAYTVEHYQQNIDDDEYTCTETDNLTGTTATTTSAAAKTYTGFTANSVSQTTIAADGTSVVKIYYDRNTITYTFDAEGGNWSGSTANQTVSGKFGATVTAPAAPTKMGYTFKEWSSTVPATFGVSPLIFTATYNANTNTVYKVEHWQQNIVDDGYAPLSAETETKFGTTGSQTNAVAKSYDGFRAKTFSQETISANGNTVVKIYYDRTTATYTFNANGENESDGKWNDNSETKTVSGKYGATVAAPASPTKTGYTFSAWSGTTSVPETFGTENLTFTASYTANTNTAYKVEHCQQNANDDEYTLKETDELTGTTATTTNAVAKSYTGFTAKSFEQTTIDANGSTVVRIEYNRDVITYTFKADGGNWNGTTANKTVSGKFGATVTAPASPTKTGYTFSTWSGTVSVPETFGTENLTFTASYTANTDTAYKVEHYQQNANDDEYTLVATDNLTGTTATQTTATAKTYEHFTADTITQSEIAADGSTVIRINYTREIVTFTLVLDGGKLGEQTGTITRTGKYGQTVNISAPTRTGYSFEGWNTVGGTMASIFTANTTYTAKWSAAGGISVTVSESDIVVTKTENHNIITFTAEECDEYIWTFEDTELGRDQTCEIDTLVLYKGIYTLYLEAKKGNNYYSYFAQIEVLFDKALVATASTIEDVLQAMTESGTVYVTGRVTISDIRSINTALKNLQASKPDILVSLNLSNATGFSKLEDASEVNTNHAFYNCTNLKEIILHNSIRTIGNNAFNGCTNLTSINISSYTESIGEGAFRNCTNLVTVKIASGVSRIGNYAFYNCKKLTDISLPNSLQRIGEYAFSGCTSLSYIKMPKNLARIEGYAFKNCTSLKEALFSNSSDWKAGNTAMDAINFIGTPFFAQVMDGNFAQLLTGQYVSRVWRVPYLDKNS
ncbi:MAG: InlB B-repeat-containing protein [Treponema sp.]|nr:InlB B-repeat-containing protein [Treponema sp.]